MSWFKSHHNSKDKGKGRAEKLDAPPLSAPPKWEPAPEKSHTFGLYNEASEASARPRDATVPPTRRWAGVAHDPPRSALVPRDSLQLRRARRRAGVVQVKTDKDCLDTCLFSDLPYWLACTTSAASRAHTTRCSYTGWTDRRHSAPQHSLQAVPGEPLPGLEQAERGPAPRRLPQVLRGRGRRTRLHAAPHAPPVRGHIGCGYEFSTGSVFFTHNGVRLPVAFSGVFLPRTAYDVYAAIGVEGKNQFDVNFWGAVPVEGG
ncbi:hypothetical protein A0H81_11261 [Grifola frondosa]|uniref:SPRY domain-containing protein n=1 Tax=Grifola frondosa TaxID=5627 RepID=A0A1C7LX80_GRIFR|nr:hypothetical protein A0H81_11261 [Grifola frondosa]